MSIADKLLQIAENEQRVYDAGKAKGFADGKQAEYDAFWDVFQNNGQRTHYSYAFAGKGWNEENFKPKYDIKVTNGERMFANQTSGAIENLTEALNECGVVLDTSECTNFSYFFMYGSPRYVPTIDMRSATSLNNFSLQSSLVSIEKIILRDDGSQTVEKMFDYNHDSLNDITFEGVVGKTWNMSTCSALSKASIESIVNALSNTTSGLTLTLKKTAVNREFATTTGANDGSTSAEWAALIATKTNWNISLA